MKAKDYAAKYKVLIALDCYTEHPASTIVKQMVQEVAALQKIRRAQTNAAMVSILQEQERKWQAFCRIVGEDSGIKSDGFRAVIKDFFPRYVIEAWEETERKSRQRQSQRRKY